MALIQAVYPVVVRHCRENEETKRQPKISTNAIAESNADLQDVLPTARTGRGLMSCRCPCGLILFFQRGLNAFKKFKVITFRGNFKHLLHVPASCYAPWSNRFHISANKISHSQILAGDTTTKDVDRSAYLPSTLSATSFSAALSMSVMYLLPKKLCGAHALSVMWLMSFLWEVSHVSFTSNACKLCESLP